MAFNLTRFEFEESIPPLKIIKSTFKSISGLELSIIGSLSLKNLSSEIDTVTEAIVNDYHKVNEYYSELKMIDELPVEEMFKYQSQKDLIKCEDNYIERLSFYNSDFYEMSFNCDENSIEIMWMINQKYFRIALTKTLYLLNNKSFQKDKEVHNYTKKEFKKLKKWNEYKWYNRPRK